MGKFYLLVFFTFSFVILAQSARQTTGFDDSDQMLQFSEGNSTRRELTGCEADKKKPGCEADKQKPGCKADKQKPGCEADKQKPGREADKQKPECDADKEKPGCDDDKEKPGGEADKEKPGGEADKVKPGGEADKVKPGGECLASNIIDKCWRCKPDWDKDRQALVKCVAGFATGTTGGSGGEIYVVTDPSDADAANPAPGSLRAGVVQNKPLWITFEKDMVITLTQELVVNSDKTIDGRGANVEITGVGISLYNVKNVIIHGLNIHDVKGAPGGMIKSSDAPAIRRQQVEGDALCLTGASNIWIDHCSFSKALDGLIDLTMKSTDVTISNCKFFNHDKALLLGAADTHTVDKDMRVTLAFNWFAEGLDQRLPRCRLGFFHIVNNRYDGWGTYAIGGSANPTILSHGNRFAAPPDRFKKNVLMRLDAPEEEWMKWNWRSEKDVLLNEAKFLATGVDPPTPSSMIVAEPGESVPDLTNAAGVLTCVPGKPC